MCCSRTVQSAAHLLCGLGANDSLFVRPQVSFVERRSSGLDLGEVKDLDWLPVLVELWL